VIANVILEIFQNIGKANHLCGSAKIFKTGFDDLNADTFYHILPIRPNMTIDEDARTQAHIVMDLLKQL